MVYDMILPANPFLVWFLHAADHMQVLPGSDLPRMLGFAEEREKMGPTQQLQFRPSEFRPDSAFSVLQSTLSIRQDCEATVSGNTTLESRQSRWWGLKKPSRAQNFESNHDRKPHQAHFILAAALELGKPGATRRF